MRQMDYSMETDNCVFLLNDVTKCVYKSTVMMTEVLEGFNIAVFNIKTYIMNYLKYNIVNIINNAQYWL